MAEGQSKSRNSGGKTKRPAAVTERRIKAADGRMKTMRFVDLASPTLDDDLLYVFRKNVEKARRDNKRVTGSADGFTAKK